MNKESDKQEKSQKGRKTRCKQTDDLLDRETDRRTGRHTDKFISKEMYRESRNEEKQKK